MEGGGRDETKSANTTSQWSRLNNRTTTITTESERGSTFPPPSPPLFFPSTFRSLHSFPPYSFHFSLIYVQLSCVSLFFYPLFPVQYPFLVFFISSFSPVFLPSPLFAPSHQVSRSDASLGAKMLC